ncbi:unannotated protein [freshwater metagenome]|uniref:Unannotated protein n=1 Tax=freshwater metagenome TaxID=449393 RepID=A0A6J7H0W9_9ZZZZ|nr:nucleoside phosphorylase [Actinomycetota bacterium]
MKLTGEIRPDRPLIVVALDIEAEHLKTLELPMLICGIGKVRAATAVATIMTAGRPSEILNLGTAGALTEGLQGTHTVGLVTQHDFDDEAIHALVGTHHGAPIELGEGLRLATGDRFIAGGPLREQLAATHDLVDMEGYAVAAAAQAADVPVRLVKHVSDPADQHAVSSWKDSVEDSAEHLADWIRAHVPH